ncbi:hypothetical protein HAX54_039357, partial [Datura stramonium]|nr:hypothetical protein [Datura stramonium]
MCFFEKKGCFGDKFLSFGDSLGLELLRAIKQEAKRDREKNWEESRREGDRTMLVYERRYKSRERIGVLEE